MIQEDITDPQGYYANLYALKIAELFNYDDIELLVLEKMRINVPDGLYQKNA